MGNYCTAANAAAVSGINASDIVAYQMTSVNNFIELLLNRNFGITNSFTDYFDGQSNQKHIQLSHYPVIAVTSFIDNQRGTTTTTLVEDTDFAVDKQAGIIELIRDDWNILKGSTSLTVGTKTVKIIYTYGYSSIPAEITLFADWLLAWIAEVKNILGATRTADGAILKSAQIGDYREAYSVENKTIDTKYKDFLAKMTELVIQKYRFWGENGDYYITL